jgi:hypothetical protein
VRAIHRPGLFGKPIRRISVARSNTIKVDCDRCGRTEYDDPAAFKRESTAFKLEFGPELSAEYGDLCTSCHKAVSNYVRQILRLKLEAKEGGDPELPEPPEVDIT